MWPLPRVTVPRPDLLTLLFLWIILLATWKRMCLHGEDVSVGNTLFIKVCVWEITENLPIYVLNGCLCRENCLTSFLPTYCFCSWCCHNRTKPPPGSVLPTLKLCQCVSHPQPLLGDLQQLVEVGVQLCQAHVCVCSGSSGHLRVLK